MKHVGSIFLIVLCFCASNTGFAQNYTVNKVSAQADSLLVLKTINRLRKEYSKTGGYGIADTLAIRSGKFNYAPDGYFKVMSVEGNAGGMYDNDLYQTFLYYKSVGKDHIRDFSNDMFYPITGIVKLTNAATPHEYLVFTNGGGRASAVEFEDNKVVVHLRFDKDTVRIMPMTLDSSSGQDYYQFMATATTLCFDENNEQHGNDNTLDFNPTDNSIRYQYYLPNKQEGESGPCKKVTGTLVYEKGRYVNHPDKED